MTTELPTTASGPAAPRPPDDDRLDKGVFVIAGVVVLGAIMSILDITVVSVAQETFIREFSATPAEVAWTMTAYMLALATVIPLTGWAADRFGTKRLYLLAVLFFTLGSELCAVAGDLTPLIVYRVVQGLGGGMLMPLGMTILTRAAGPHRVGRVMAVLGIPMLLGPIIGPILGGWLIEIASWHWIFLINLPIGIGAMVYAWFALPKDHVEPSESSTSSACCCSRRDSPSSCTASHDPRGGHRLGRRGALRRDRRPGAHSAPRALGAQQAEPAPVARAAALREQEPHRRGAHHDGPRDRVLRGPASCSRSTSSRCAAGPRSPPADCWPRRAPARC